MRRAEDDRLFVDEIANFVSQKVFISGNRHSGKKHGISFGASSDLIPRSEISSVDEPCQVCRKSSLPERKVVISHYP